jgi:secondary thiamine-phosphate synthase enzyme
MPAHIRAALTQTSLTIPVIDGEAALGTWQGVYLWEHRAEAQDRHVIVQLLTT